MIQVRQQNNLTWPEYRPSGAMKSSFFRPYRMGFLNVTCKCKGCVVAAENST